MLSPSLIDANKSANAESKYREAFERLKYNKPKILKKGSAISLKNVSIEAGSCASALKPQRYPRLALEIKQWMLTSLSKGRNDPSTTKTKNEKRSHEESVKALAKERDLLASLLVEADARILELTQEVNRLRANPPKLNIVPITNR